MITKHIWKCKCGAIAREYEGLPGGRYVDVKVNYFCSSKIRHNFNKKIRNKKQIERLENIRQSR